MVSKEMGKWPPGRASIPQEMSEALKRERCAAAICELAHEVGAARLTVSLVTSRSGISRSTFYALFAGFDAATDHALNLSRGKLIEPIEDAVRTVAPWEEQVRSLLGALTGAALADPFAAELCLVHGPALLEMPTGPYDRDVVQAVAGGIKETAPASDGSPPLLAELCAYGAVSMVSQCLVDSRLDDLADLHNPVAEMIIRLYEEGVASSRQGCS
ncbi:MAG TPA: TetR/AcrR family transcriptional regulator [Solirubrobacterales bacterium]|nr:TetR/AcrR family transcriptional regulator [Solirubrobacterales bacterium]